MMVVKKANGTATPIISITIKISKAMTISILVHPLFLPLSQSRNEVYKVIQDNQDEGNQNGGINDVKRDPPNRGRPFAAETPKELIRTPH